MSGGGTRQGRRILYFHFSNNLKGYEQLDKEIIEIAGRLILPGIGSSDQHFPNIGWGHPPGRLAGVPYQLRFQQTNKYLLFVFTFG
jgi:hypothetical protein